MTAPASDHDRPLFVIALDRQITRRKFYHILTDPNGTVLYRSKRLSDMIAALEALDQHQARLDCPEGRSLIMTLRASDRKDP